MIHEVNHPLAFENLVTDASMTPNDLLGLIIGHFKEFLWKIYFGWKSYIGFSGQKFFFLDRFFFQAGIDTALRGEYCNDDEIVISRVRAVKIAFKIADK